MKDEALLDDNNINSNLTGSLMTELRKTEQWHLITATISFVLAAVCFLITMVGLFLGIFLEYPFFVINVVLGLFLVLFGVYQFKNSKSIRWLNEHFTVYTLENVYMWLFKSWRAFSFVLLGALMLIVVVFSLFLGKSEPSSEPVELVPISTAVE